LTLLALFGAAWWLRSAAGRHLEEEAELLARRLPFWTGLPFAGILLSIALCPLLAPRFWERHYKRVAIAWALLLAIPFVSAFEALAIYKILEVVLIDYVPFLILLWGLYTVSGGILLRGTMVGTPVLNTLMLLVGTVLASWMGTTGASMLLVRPLLRANAARRQKSHVFIFFIFLVANIGGALTPLGDPPLFLGLIHGVPFFWTLKLLPVLLFVTGILLAVFFALDTWFYSRELRRVRDLAERGGGEPLRLEGGRNFLWLGGILAAVLLSGTWHAGHLDFYGIHLEVRNLARDLAILAMGFLSIRTTSQRIRRDNGFTWHPIQEVGFLFFGIFMTIIPVLMILHAGTHGQFAFLVSRVTESWHYFWITGLLSSFLDNAPTYLTFFNLALGQLDLTQAEVGAILRGVLDHPDGPRFAGFLLAISAGAVFMGANTYIGNAPNFMVLSIAQENQVKMPSFFGYMAWSGLVLLPVFLLVTLVFFR
jgi:Na+/H+ antiporter NhaD/arsenite permease-like protein